LLWRDIILISTLMSVNLLRKILN
jgi:hypothetical protein